METKSYEELDELLAQIRLLLLRVRQSDPATADEVGPPTIAAMEHALTLDPGQSEALAVKALMTALLDHDWEIAGRLYQQAVTSSESQYAISSYAVYYLEFIDQRRQAIKLYAKLEKLDPLHAGIKANLGGIYYWSVIILGLIK